MFYNSKKLIDEKVLQQYYFEQFMTATLPERAALLPPNYRAAYAPTTSVKVLRPEVSIAKGFTVDFVLYHRDRGKHPPLNIELKWRTSDFAREQGRHRWFDGSSGNGFVVALKDDAAPAPNIPFVRLSPTHFQEWFVNHSSTIVAQTLYRKLGHRFVRPNGSRYWLVYIGEASLDHYLNSALTQGVWAYKDRNPAKNIMRMMADDFVVFVRQEFSRPSRLFVADDEPNDEDRRSAHNRRLYPNSDIAWALASVDVFRIIEGYHLNFSNQSPYGVFEAPSWRKSATPETKEYTQFIRFDNTGAEGGYLWAAHAPPGHCLDRKLFPARVVPLKRFVEATRRACANRGDVVEIAEPTYRAVRALFPH